MRRRLAVGMVLGVAAAAGAAYGQSAATQQLLDDADKAYEADKLDKAAANYDRAIAAEPKGVKPEAYAKRALIFMAQAAAYGKDGNSERAVKKYEQGLAWITGTAERIWPDQDVILEKKALILDKLPGRRADAVAIAEKITARTPRLFGMQLMVGEHYYQGGAGTAEKTVKAYEGYFSHRGDASKTIDGFTRVKLGFSYLHLRRWDDAIKQFDEAERKFKSDANIAGNARKGLCAAYAYQEDWSKAITLCEAAIRDKPRMKGDPSAYFHIGTAYLKGGQFDNALAAANSYIAAKPKSSGGYLLRGDVYYEQKRWNDAESQYNQASTIEPNNGKVARALGRVYLRQKRAKKAIETLSKVVQADPQDVDTRYDLGEAYIQDGQGANAATQAAEGLKTSKEPRTQVRFYALAGAGYYASGELTQARMSFEKAIVTARDNKLPQEGAWQTGLLNTINRQAAAKFKAGDLKGAEALLFQARDIDPEHTVTNQNLGLVAIEQKQWSEAIKYLTNRLKKGPNDLITNRLLGRAYLGAKNEQKAGEHYAIAETEAKKLRNLTVLAEVYTEWAPLLLAAGKVDDAVDKLEQAAQYAVNQPFAQQTQRNYQVALFKRGYEKLRKGKGSEAVADLEGATRFPALLVGNEEQVYTFALGLAYLDGGQYAKASPIFQDLAKKGSAGWLKPPFDKVGAELFVAYAMYREGSSGSRAKAAGVFEKLSGKTTGSLNAKIKDLLRSSQEFLAYEAFGKGAFKDAEAALKKAAGMGGGNKNAVDHNMAVLSMDKNGSAAKAVFEKLKEKVPEALVNLGILADRAGESKAAFELWSEARAKGARSGKLDDWIAAKKKIFGFGGGGQ